MALTLSGTNGVVGAGFTVDASGVSVTAGVGTFTSYQGSAASLTQIPAANIVGVATAGFGNASGAYSQGITEVDQWRLTTNFSGSVEPLANNLERNDNNFTKIGSGMSVSSGYWTFPSTGIWRIEMVRDAFINGDERELRIMIYYTVNNSNYYALTENASNIRDFNANGHGQVYTQAIFDVTNTTTHKIYFRVLNDNSSTQTIGRTGENQTYFTFTRLGDT